MGEFTCGKENVVKSFSVDGKDPPEQGLARGCRARCWLGLWLRVLTCDGNESKR